jgi:uncharacterized protein with LGFP repeats
MIAAKACANHVDRSAKQAVNAALPASDSLCRHAARELSGAGAPTMYSTGADASVPRE